MNTVNHDISISVVIPAYNAEKYLGECLESVLSQSRLPEEILIIDDGSKDATLEIARKYESDHPILIKVLQHPGGENRGVSVSRNLGILKASSLYIAFIDADDTWLPHKLEIQYKSIRSNPDVPLFSAKTSFIDSEGNQTTLRGFTTSGRGKQGIQPDTFNILLHENTVNATTSIVKKSALVRAGLFSENIHTHEDWLMWLKISAFGDLYFDDTIVATYRQHGESKLLKAKKTRQGPLSEVSLMADLYAYLDEEFPECKAQNASYLKFSVRRIFVRARSLSFSGFEMRELRDALLHHFPAMHMRIKLLYTILMMIPSSLLSMVRVLRRSIVKV